MSTREGPWGGVRSGSERKQLSPRSRFVSKGRKTKTKKQWDQDDKRISVARDAHVSYKKLKYMCVYSPDTAFASSFVPRVAKKSDVPICSARTSLTYPSSFCQAGSRTTAGEP